MENHFNQAARYLIVLAWCCAPVAVHAEIFSYVDPASGVILMSNVAPPASQSAEKTARFLTLDTHAAAESAGSRPGFPVVSNSVQQERDQERRTILQQELTHEQQHLAAALARQDAASLIHRHQENIAALKRELLVFTP